MKKDASYHILRVGIAITFLCIGVLIFKEPDYWAGFLQPWAVGLLPVPLREAMIGTAVLDVAVSFFLLIDVLAWVAALAAMGHLVIVLVTAGITEVTVRDIGLLSAAAALCWSDLPEDIKRRLKRRP